MAIEELNIITSDNNTVVVTTEDRIVTVSNEVDTTNVILSAAETTVVQIATIGQRGLQGPSGSQGPKGDTAYFDSSSFATTGSNTFYGNQLISGSSDFILQIHGANDNPWAFGIYNDTYTPTQSVLAGWVGNDGIAYIGTEVNTPLQIYTNANYWNPTLIISSSGITIDNTLIVSSGITGSLYNKTFTKNNTSTNGVNVILSKENVFNHGNLLVESDDTLIIEDGAEYFVLGNLTNSGSIIVSGSLIVHGGIYNEGTIIGPGPILSNSTIVTYDKANLPYGFLQLDGNGNIINTINLLGTASYSENSNQSNISLTASYIDPLFISASANYYGFGAPIDTSSFITNSQTGSFITYLQTGSFATTGSNTFSGSQTITGSVNISGQTNFNNAVAVNDSNLNLTNSSSLNLTSGSGIFIDGGSLMVTNGGITGSLYNKPFLKNETTSDSVNTIISHENIFNHGDLLIKAEDTLIIEQGAEYFVLGNLTNSGSIIVSGSLIVHGIISNNGNIIGPGPVLSNTTIVTYDKANIPYGFAQLDVNGNLSSSINLLGTASFALTASHYTESDPIFTAKSGSFATTGSNIFVGDQIISGSAGTLAYGNINTNGLTLADIHANNDYPWLERFYNDTFSTSSAVMAYYGDNQGSFFFHNESTQSISINVGSYDNNTGLSVYMDKVTFANNIEVAGGITGSLYNEAFSKNRTTTGSVNTIKQYQSIFNPSNLFIQENHIFIVEENAEYYVLGDVVNSGSIVVDGTFKIGGALLNNGSITGIGIIE